MDVSEFVTGVFQINLAIGQYKGGPGLRNGVYLLDGNNLASRLVYRLVNLSKASNCWPY